ncbi:MAG: tRNA 4-thiouridine(8) synthase ThiI [Anaerotignum sp.]|nr:tRNA 4-thiouridine(8) synthase ThiI [Anaerotignum sp.]
MNEQNILIVRCGEVALKGMNKPYFERMLVDRIKRNLKSFEGVDVRRHEGLIFVRAEKDLDIDAIVKQISKVFGVASISKAVEAPSELNAIGDEAVKYMMNLIEERGVKTFKVEGKRADKTFPVKSPDLGRIIGAKILVGCKVLKVDVHQPDVLLHVDVRSDRTYIYEGKIAGFGGLPLGTNGKGLTLLSGGIDSPVATWMMAKRGVEVEGVYFHSPTYTSEWAKEKVMDLAKRIADFTGEFRLYVVPFTELQLYLLDNTAHDRLTIHLKRCFMRAAEMIANKDGALALVTGESVGQVASQTMQGIQVINAVCDLPVLRPLAGMDKSEIVERAEKIGTFEISIRPYEDCCTVFVAKHPVTKPRLNYIERAEHKLTELDRLLEEAVANAEIIDL